MPKKIDWLYSRKYCETCQKAAKFRDDAGTVVKEAVDGTKVKYGPDDALKLLDGVDKLIATKGPKITKFDLKKNRPTDVELLAVLIGPKGTLRAPTVRVGKTMLVGFNEETYAAVLG